MVRGGVASAATRGNVAGGRGRKGQTVVANRSDLLSARSGARFARLFIFATVFLMTEVDLFTTREGGIEYALELHIVSLIGLAWVVLSSLGWFLPKGNEARIHTLVLTCDVILITGFLHLTGGTTSNYYPLYYMPILHACVRLSVRDSISSALLCVGSYAILGYVGGISAELTTTAGFRILIFGTTAMFMAVFFAVLIRMTREKEDQINRTSELLRRMTVMFEMAQTLGSTLDRERIVDSAASCAARAVEAEAAALYLADPSGRELELVAVAGPADLRTHIGSTPEPLAWANGTFQASAGSEAPSSTAKPRPPLRSVISVAFRRAQSIAGVLQVFNKGPEDAFPPEDSEVLTSIANQAAAELENARLVGQLRDNLDELNATHARLAQSEKLSALGKLISGIAHELNNPLAAVMGYTELISQEPLADRPRARVEQVYEAAGRCKRIVDSLLAFARKDEPEMERVDLNRLMDEAASMLAGPLKAAGVEVVRELDPDLPITAGDSHQIRQVFINLLENAAQALAAVEPPRQVTTRTYREGDYLVAEVADEGPGVPEPIRDRVFDPFFTTRASGEGTGLGLSLSYGIVTAHRGSITLRPNEPRGAIFTVRLPHHLVLQEEPAAEAPAWDEIAIQGRVLLVESDAQTADMIAEAFEDPDCELIRVSDGAEALRRIVRRPFDAIIADAAMAGTSAEEFLTQLRHWSPDQASRVIFMASDTGSPSTMEFLFTLETPVFAEPFRLGEVRSAAWRVSRRPHVARPAANKPEG